MFGPFRVLHQVGTGTLGAVYRAHDAAEGRLVAVKVFNLDLPAEHALELVEALNGLVARDLAHPSIAQPLAAGLEGPTPWLAQAYVPAESLDAALRQYGPPPADESLALLTHLAGALDFAAIAGVRHGALHPGDVLVAPDETHLVGLGVAAALEQIGVRPPVRPPYSAPEQVAGGPVSRAGDIYSLAAIAWELLIGQPLPGPRTGADTVPSVAGFDRDALTAAFASAASGDPDDRPATALGFVAALRAAVSDAAALSTASVPTTAAPSGMAIAGDVTDAPDPAGRSVGDTSAPFVSAEEDPDPSPAVSMPHVGTDDVGTPGPRLFDAVDRTADSDHDLQLHPAVTGAGNSWDRRAGATDATDGDHDLSTHAWRPPANAATAGRSRAGGPSWRLIATVLIVGITLGFGGAYVWLGETSTAPAASIAGRRDPSANTGAVPQSAPATAPAPARGTSPAPREFTDNAVPEAPSITSAPVEPAPPADRESTTTNRTPAAAAASPQAQRRAPIRGQLIVRSRPSGARVEVNGRPRGEAPLDLDDLPLGAYTLRVTQDGYAPEQRRVTLTAGRHTQDVTVPMRRLPERTVAARPAAAAPSSPATSASGEFVGSVLVESRPSGARVFIDGKLVGVTPLSVAEVSAGSHVVRIDLTGHSRWSSAVRVVSGERVRVAASLEEEIVR